MRKLEARTGLTKYTGRPARQLRAALYLGLLFAASTAFYPIPLAYSGEWELAVLLAGGALCYASPVLLIPRGMVRTAKILPGVTLCGLVYVLGGVLGASSNIHLALFLLLGWCMSVIDLQRERVVLGLLLSFAGVTFILVQEGLTFRVGGLEPYEPMLGLMHQTMPGAVFLIFIFVLAPFYRRSQVDEDRLERSLGQLEEEIQRRVLAEHSLREASTRLADASQAKSNFIAMMGHELRTPLNGVLGINQLLKDTPLQDEQREMLQAVEESGQKLLSLVNDILDYVNVRSGTAHHAKIPFDLLELCEDSAKSFEVAAARNGIELDLVIAPETPALVVGDPSRIRQTLKELIGNALKHTTEGWIYVEVDGTSDANRGTFRFSVTDSGPGVPEEHRVAIFDEFTQSRVGPSRDSAGIGLGLAFCKRLLATMGGTLELECPAEGGSRFTMVLPMEVPTQPVVKCPLSGLAFAVRAKSVRAQRSLEAILTRLGATVGADGADVIQLNLDDGAIDATSEDVPVVSETRRIGRQLLVRRQVLRELKPWLGELLPPSSRAETGPLRALVVEDNVVNQKVLTKLLENLGASVQCVANGALALDIYRESPLDVIFMDVEMPVMNGLDATMAIRAMPGGSRIPIVGVSANATPEEQQRGLAAGMNCYLPKPVRKDQVTEVLRTVYRKRPLPSHLSG